MNYIINGRIWTGLEEIPDGYVSYENGIITGTGPMTGFQGTDGDVLDAGGGFVVPGLIDAHSHAGVWGEWQSWRGNDCREKGALNPQLELCDSVNPRDPSLKKALEAGITTVVAAPDDNAVIGGRSCAIKTCGRTIDQMLVSRHVAMEFAMGQSVRTDYPDGTPPHTRMGAAAMLRRMLICAKEYAGEVYDSRLEALKPVVLGELPVFFRAERSDDIATAIRLTREFGLKTVIVNGTDGDLLANELVKEKIPVIFGPVLRTRSQLEIMRLEPENGVRMYRKGVKMAFQTAHPVTPVWKLTSNAAAACSFGMDRDAALRAVTAEAARICGIDSRVGSLEPGKDADIAVFTSHPLDDGAKIKAVFAAGIRVR